MNKRPQSTVGKRHTASRILRYVFAGYKLRFFLVLLCILVSAIASVGASLFLQALIDNYIAPLLAMDVPNYTPPAPGPADDGLPVRHRRPVHSGLQPDYGDHLPGRAEDHP